MKQHNYSSKGLNIKKMNNKIMMADSSYSKQKEFLMKLPYFKNLKILEDAIKDKNWSDKFTKEYLITSKKKNDLDELIEADEYSNVQLCVVLTELYKKTLSDRLNR